MVLGRDFRASNSIPKRYCELSSAGKALVATMHRVQFGRFEGLRIFDSDPVFDPPPRVVKVSKIGSGEEPEVSESDDWDLKASVRDLFREFARLQNGTIDRLEFRWGLPCLVEISIAAVQTDTCRVDRGKQ